LNEDEPSDEAAMDAVLESSTPPDSEKVNALLRLQRLERRGVTVGTHLDEMRALLTILFRRLSD
jgi:hypothetical protein